ncbi:3-hydroxy-3-methylglutaryl-CoA synthase [Schizosaccharomyces japonicus yFS275]|uniref:Hydroxymethylglutaryl-CoA synthase n=1 Tax=Schizosaccharomyces japonicus (strain yFS275 / FY16936) TaxID=402676 RepID=B6K6Z8_SCHJY|nr:3-hydroxy-3-methylglutaryl-CoA synthase [Schizosaccharomyces japonicus yFS275]EEB09302.2 3-hydroxy-3-methylglutaryl-CoA synthase [Schizosaccharomyces japonicus yFS275]
MNMSTTLNRKNIGIKGISIYVPNQYVEQAALEKHDGIPAGKYTIGLGLTKMSFVDDREDIYSFALTALSTLIKKYNVDVNAIGRLEMGTETIIDKSKSVKSVLMQLMGDNHNVEGIDCVNACYGGVNALFNTIDWIESSAWDGRDGIVVAGDIALYAKGNARPTGGAGCVAMLVGPDAPIVFEPGMRGSYMQHAYDFYKPDLTSEYPYVDGHFSLQCYIKALDGAYQAYNKREQTLTGKKPTGLGIDRFDYCIFHAPTCKQVQKAYARLMYTDFAEDPKNPEFDPVREMIESQTYEQSLTDKPLEKALMAVSKERYNKRVLASIYAPTNCGNMYTGSVFSCLSALLSRVPAADLKGKRVGAYSYGSGLAASFFSFRVEGDISSIAEKLDLVNILENRHAMTPVEYEECIELRHKIHLKKNIEPAGSVERLRSGTYYLTKVDDMFRREYAVKP